LLRPSRRSAFPEVGAGDRPNVGDPTAVDPAGWRLVRLRTAKPAGSDNLVDIELLRPLEWLRENGVAAGGTMQFVLPELELDGPAEVLAVEACPPPERGRGRVVTGTFTTARCEVLELRLAGQADALEPTPPHRFFSEDRQDWIAARDLRPGERLRTASGQVAAVESIRLKPGQHRVYNLEVEQEHQFFVGEAGVLVHNAYSEQARLRLRGLPEELGVYHIKGNGKKYTGSAVDLQKRLANPAHPAFELLNDPGSEISYETVGLGNAAKGRQTNHVLRSFEQEFMTENGNVPMTDGSLNQIRAAAEARVSDFRQESLVLGASRSGTVRML
jgi:hypothetical protein